MSTSKTATKAAKATAKKKVGGFDYDSSGQLPRLIPMQNGDVLLRDPIDGRTRRLTGDLTAEIDAYVDHPLYGQIVGELAAMGRLVAKVVLDEEAA